MFGCNARRREAGEVMTPPTVDKSTLQVASTGNVLSLSQYVCAVKL